MLSGEPLDVIKRSGVIPVVTLETSEQALPLCEALLEGGLHVMEITYRSAAAAGAIGLVSERYPEMYVGAGTVTSVREVRQAHAQGARFAVAPGLNPEVVQMAQREGLTFWPGVATPTEIEHALALGVKTLKFFPARELGGPGFLQAAIAPYLHLGVEVIPTGGIDEDSAPAYWGLVGVAAVGGSWVAPRELIAAKDWREISRRARATNVRYLAIQGKEM